MSHPITITTVSVSDFGVHAPQEVAEEIAYTVNLVARNATALAARGQISVKRHGAAAAWTITWQPLNKRALADFDEQLQGILSLDAQNNEGLTIVTGSAPCTIVHGTTSSPPSA